MWRDGNTSGMWRPPEATTARKEKLDVNQNTVVSNDATLTAMGEGTPRIIASCTHICTLVNLTALFGMGNSHVGKASCQGTKKVRQGSY